MLPLSILSISFLVCLFLLTKKKTDIILHPGFVFFFYSVTYIIFGNFSLLFELNYVFTPYQNDKILNLDNLIIFSAALGLILFCWLASFNFRTSNALKSSFTISHSINYVFATSLFFLPSFFAEPVAAYVSTTSSLKLFDNLSKKYSSLTSKLISLIIPIIPLLLSAVLTATSKRVSVFPFVIAFLVTSLRHSSVTHIKLKQVTRSLLLIVALPFLFFIVMTLQLLRNPEVSITHLQYVAYFLSPQNLFKLFEFSTLYVHSINFWNLIQQGVIDQTIFSPILKLVGLGILPFTGDRILSFNDIYTGTVDPLYRQMGGSHPTLKWISSLGLFYFPLNLVYPTLSLYLLSASFRLCIKYFNALPIYVIFPYYSATFARGSDISLAFFELAATLCILLIAYLLSRLTHKLLPVKSRYIIDK